MTRTIGYAGRGSKLSTSPDGSTYTAVAQLKSLTYSGLKATTDDITNLDSPNAYKELLPTVIDPGDVTFDGILNPSNASDNNLLALLNSQVQNNFKITLTDGTEHTFSGYVTEYVPAKVDYSKAIMFSGKISITGPVTVTPAP